MEKIIIKYNPYEMKSKLIVRGQEIHKSKHCVSNLKRYLDENTSIPIQYWIDPIFRDKWGGLLKVLCDYYGEKLEIEFSGRKVDYEDIKKSLEIQNESREKKATLKFNLKNELPSDMEMKRKVEAILSDDFYKLVKKIESEELLKKYYEFKKISKETIFEEFRIAFIGTPNSDTATLVNALIKKEFLPQTTTQICKIIHANNIENLAIIKCNGREYIFNTCEEIKNKIKELDDSNEEITIYTDLSTLLLNDLENDFKLVLINAPNIDNIINNQIESELVIACCDERFDNKEINKMLDIIGEYTKKSKDYFNKSLLFAINNCDSLMFDDPKETLEKQLLNFIENINKRIKSICNGDFISPKLFPTSASSALAVINGYTTSVKRMEETNNEKVLYDKYKDFCQKVYHWSSEELQNKSIQDIKQTLSFYENHKNYSLEEHGSSSEFRKNEFKEKLENEQTTIPERILIHSGIPSLEITIQEYIKNYSYPIKVGKIIENITNMLREIEVLYNEKNEELNELYYKINNILKNDEKESNFNKIHEDNLEIIKNKIYDIKNRITYLSEVPPKIEVVSFEHNNKDINLGNKIKNIFINKKNKIVEDLYNEFIYYAEKFEEVGVLDNVPFSIEYMNNISKCEIVNTGDLLDNYLKDMGIIKTTSPFFTEAFVSNLIIKRIKELTKGENYEYKFNEYIKKLEDAYRLDIQQFKTETEKRLQEILNILEDININFKILTDIKSNENFLKTIKKDIFLLNQFF